MFSRITQKIIRTYQKLTRGYSDNEIWSLDWSTAEYMLPRLKALRAAEKQGVSMEFLLDKLDHTEEELEFGGEVFNLYIDTMIYAFECVLDDNKDMPALGEVSFKDHKIVSTTTPEQYSAYRTAHSVRGDKIELGLSAFAKYFHSLNC